MKFHTGIVAVEESEFFMNASESVAFTHFVGEGRTVVVNTQVNPISLLIDFYIDASLSRPLTDAMFHRIFDDGLQQKLGNLKSVQ